MVAGSTPSPISVPPIQSSAASYNGEGPDTVEADGPDTMDVTLVKRGEPINA